MVNLPTIRSALADRPAHDRPPSHTTAAVAMAFAGPPSALELCFILRAVREGDRWSGQMALPGGRAEPGDATVQAVAIREAHEEVGLRLHEAEPLGVLPELSLSPTDTAGVLVPFAFYVGERPPPLRPNDGEVADAFWIPLPHLWDEQQRDTIDWEWKGQSLRFPGIRFRDQIIWGLTFRVLSEWAMLVGRPLPGGGGKPKLVR